MTLPGKTRHNDTLRSISLKGEAPITPGRYISPFWYHRVSEITLLIAGLIIGLYIVGRYVLGITTGALFVPLEALVFASITALYSLSVIIFARHKSSWWLALGAFVLTALTLAVLLALTGNARSPFVALWLFVGAFAGLFGWWTWGAVFAAANLGVVHSIFFSGQVLGGAHIIEMVLVAEIPLIASYIIWHDQAKEKDNSAYTALAEQLTQVANKSDIVITSIADGVVAMDQRGIVQLINPAAQTMLGWPQQDAIGLDYKSVIKLVDHTGAPIPDTMSPISQVLGNQRSLLNNELGVMTKAGKKTSVSLVVSPVQGVGGAIAVFRDITREKEEERQKAEFISTASHEMRTPVAAIEGYLSLAMNPQTATIDDKARLYLQKAHESTQHLGRLFQDLLTVSKAEDARLIPRPAAIDIIGLLREIIFGLQPKAKEKGIFLSFPAGSTGEEGSSRVIAPSFYVRADPDQTREVLTNLIDNAIKYTKEGSATVEISATPDSVTVGVTDTGIGIPPEDLPHLFQKFYRVDNSETREIGGTGLGLYISRRLVEANGGRISVTSTYGKGSTFSIELPRISHEQAVEEMAATSAAAAKPHTAQPST